MIFQKFAYIPNELLFHRQAIDLQGFREVEDSE